MSEYTVLIGDCRARLAELDDKSVQMCVTSPPYYGLRDYKMGAQIGLEQTPAAFIAELALVFREIRRVLKDDGTLWVNIGDSYARAGGWSNNSGLGGVKRGDGNRAKSNLSAGGGGQRLAAGLKEKDLIGIPWRLAFALQDDGWYLRQDIIWHKPNPMPGSQKDRCTTAHEYIFLLSKKPKYFFDHAAIKEKAVGGANNKSASFKRDNANKRSIAHPGQSSGTHREEREDVAYNGDTRTKRSVWTVATKPYKGAHFAVFPAELIRPCILAGSRLGDTVLDPFGGSGTTGAESIRLGRKAIMVELNPDYAPLIKERCQSAVNERDNPTPKKAKKTKSVPVQPNGPIWQQHDLLSLIP